jgi:hypothetical protein
MTNISLKVSRNRPSTFPKCKLCGKINFAERRAFRAKNICTGAKDASQTKNKYKKDNSLKLIAFKAKK